MYNILYKYKSVFILIVKLLIISGTFYFISNKILNNEILNNSEFYTYLRLNVLNNYSVILTILLFTITNWVLEILKWRSLVSVVTNISFYESSKQSLSSLTASLLTPNRIGEYGVKAIYYPKHERKKIMLLTFLGNFGQMFTTLLFGFIGFYFLIINSSFRPNATILQTLFFAFVIGSITILLFKRFLNYYWRNFMLILKDISLHTHLHNFFFSFFRYLIFSHQFYFLLIIFGGGLDYHTAMPIIFTMYFLASIIPGFVIFDWLIKGSVAVSLFNFFGINEILILSITSLMWLLNFALPSIIGSYFVLTFNRYQLAFKEIRIRK